MRAWIALVLLGTLALATGGGLLILNQHRTIGLGGLGLGALLIIFGLVGHLLDRNAIGGAKNTSNSAGRRGGVRRAIGAILVIILVGVGTFYGASYLSSTQAGGGTTNHSTRTGLTTRSTSVISTAIISTSRPLHTSTQSVTSVSSITGLTNISSSQSATVSRSCLTSTKSLDGSAIEYNASGTSGMVRLTTISSSDVIILFVSTLGQPNGSSSAPPRVENVTDSTLSLSFHQRASIVTAVPNIDKVKFSEEEWYATTNVPLTNDSIVVNLSANTAVLTIIAFGVSGANGSSPFDPNSEVPVGVTGTTVSTISAAVSTSCSNDMVLGGAIMATLNPEVGLGYTVIQSDNGKSAGQDPIAEFQVLSSPQAGLEITFRRQGLSGPQSWIVIGDALN